MKLGLTGGGVLALAAVASLAVGGVVLYVKRREIAAGVSEAASAVGQAVNPTSDQNLAYRGVNAVGEAVTGDASFSLGAWLFEAFNPGAVQAERDVLRSGLPQASYDETARLARRYPAPEPVVTPYVGGFDFGGSFGYGMP